MILSGVNVSSILITCRNKQLAMRNYVPAIHVAGWHKPIHLVSPDDPTPNLEGVAGLLLSGGGDVNPKYWDEEVHPKAQLDDGRDEMELALIKAAWEKGIPILGICRGEQILNVALGGSMVQDIPDHFGCEPSLHQHGTPDIPEVRHNVSVTHNSRLFQLLGAASVPVNSRHHQAVRELAPDLRAVAFHPETLKDGKPLVEGIEAKDMDRWAVGVQWHPENLVSLGNSAGSSARRLFHGFVAAVQDYSYARASHEAGAKA